MPYNFILPLSVMKDQCSQQHTPISGLMKNIPVKLNDFGCQLSAHKTILALTYNETFLL